VEYVTSRLKRNFAVAAVAKGAMVGTQVAGVFMKVFFV